MFLIASFPKGKQQKDGDDKKRGPIPTTQQPKAEKVLANPSPPRRTRTVTAPIRAWRDVWGHVQQSRRHEPRPAVGSKCGIHHDRRSVSDRAIGRGVGQKRRHAHPQFTRNMYGVPVGGGCAYLPHVSLCGTAPCVVSCVFVRWVQTRRPNRVKAARRRG